MFVCWGEIHVIRKKVTDQCASESVRMAMTQNVRSCVCARAPSSQSPNGYLYRCRVINMKIAAKIKSTMPMTMTCNNQTDTNLNYGMTQTFARFQIVPLSIFVYMAAFVHVHMICNRKKPSSTSSSSFEHLAWTAVSLSLTMGGEFTRVRMYIYEISSLNRLWNRRLQKEKKSENCSCLFYVSFRLSLHSFSVAPPRCFLTEDLTVLIMSDTLFLHRINPNKHTCIGTELKWEELNGNGFLCFLFFLCHFSSLSDTLMRFFRNDFRFVYFLLSSFLRF